MTAFARPELDRASWWAELEPLLSDKAARDYSYLDPSVIPARRVSGPGTLVGPTSGAVGMVDVPTDIGVYRVTLSRDEATSPWRVERFTPPEGGN